MVKGYVKGSGYRIGEPVTSTNEYCIVYVDGSWRFVDPHWGSQYVISDVDNNNDWEIISDEATSGGKAKNDETGGQQTELGSHCDDFYFLTDPVAMVYTHLTIDPDMQVYVQSPKGGVVPGFCFPLRETTQHDSCKGVISVQIARLGVDR